MVQASVTARVARGWSCCWHECDWSGCARGWKTCMLGAGPPRDGIIRTSPGQECSKDKGALPGARRIFVYAVRFWSTAARTSIMWFKPHRLVLHLDEKRVSLYPAKRRSARSSMDRASDYGSEGWGFESLRARSGPPRCDPPVGVLHFEKHSFGSAFSCPPPSRCEAGAGHAGVPPGVLLRFEGLFHGLTSPSDSCCVCAGLLPVLRIVRCPRSGRYADRLSSIPGAGWRSRLGPGATRIGCAYLDRLCACG